MQMTFNRCRLGTGADNLCRLLCCSRMTTTWSTSSYHMRFSASITSRRSTTHKYNELFSLHEVSNRHARYMNYLRLLCSFQNQLTLTSLTHHSRWAPAFGRKKKKIKKFMCILWDLVVQVWNQTKEGNSSNFFTFLDLHWIQEFLIIY
jgi:hypothetical protein